MKYVALHLHALWNHPDSKFHCLWNGFMRITFMIALINPAQRLQELLDKAFYSCPPWQYTRGNTAVACWCLLFFQEIIQFLLIS